LTALRNPLIRGRDTELAVLRALLVRVRSGAGGVLLVEGAAGMGKSRLIGEAMEMARDLSFRVGSGLAEPGENVVDLAALMEALFDGTESLVDPAELGDFHASPEQRYWLLQDIQALLERAAIQAPLLLCLDDQHWADSGTAAALRALPTRLAALPIAWVIAFRPGEGSAHVRRAIDHLEQAGAERLVLHPLDPSGVAEVTADVLGGQPDSALLEMTGRAHGNPFLLVELLLGLQEERSVRLGSGRVELVEDRLPSRIRDKMRSRLDRMPTLQHEVILVAAVLGRRFSFADLAAMVAQSPSALLGPVEALIQGGMLVELDSKLAFGHDLIREAVRASLPVSVRRGLDRQAATVLLAGGALPVEVALQLAASAEPGDEVAITTLLEAAKALANTDPGSAADLGQRALELASASHPLRGPLVAQTVISLHAAGRSDEAKAFADMALRHALSLQAEAQVRLSIAGMFAIGPDVRAAESRRALTLAGLPVDLRARHLALLVLNLMTAGRPEEGRVILDEATIAVQERHDIAGQFIVELAESGLRYADGHFGWALERVEKALRTGVNASDDTRGHLTRQWHCDVLAVADRFEEAHQISTENVAAAQRDRQGWALNMFETGRGRVLLQMGRLGDAGAALEERFAADAAFRVVSVLDAAGVVNLGFVAMHTGSRGPARRAAELARAMFDDGAPSVRRHAVWLLAVQAAADDDMTEAHRWLCALGEDQRTFILPRFPMDPADAPRLVRIALAAEDLDLAASAAGTATNLARLNPGNRSLAAAAAHANGLLDTNQASVAEAVALFERGPRPLALASALEDLGAGSIDRDATDDGVDAFGRALLLYSDAGATWDASRVRGRLRALGIRRRLAPTRHPDRGWAAITDSELAVARLVAQGCTNREVAERLFVSPHTVGGHLRHMFTKLDINSRAQLTRLADQHDRPPRARTGT
jgi:DNA-binding CsgD family transcriptional regulator